MVEHLNGIGVPRATVARAKLGIVGEPAHVNGESNAALWRDRDSRPRFIQQFARLALDAVALLSQMRGAKAMVPDIGGMREETTALGVPLL